MNRNELIEKTFDLSNATAEFLLMMRIVTDFDGPTSSLKHDIYDLYQYPQRLKDSYLQEWRSWIKRVLHTEAFNDATLSDAESLQAWLDQTNKIHHHKIVKNYKEYVKVLELVEVMQESDNITPMKTRVQRTLDMLMQM